MRPRVLPSETYYVYRLLFPNGKSYIGITANFEGRMGHHSYGSKKTYVGKAVNKYGWKNVQKEILETTDSWQKVLKLETHYIDRFNSFYKSGLGYNLTMGGEGLFGVKRTFSEGTKRKMALAKLGKPGPWLGKHHDEESKIKMSNSRKGRPSPNKGKCISTNIREKIAQTLGRGTVEVFDKQSNKIGTWTIISQCARDLNVHVSNITACLKGRLKSTGGYIFRYIEEGSNEIPA